eukprot:403356230
MLHELLLALFGHTGSIIQEDQDGFVVNPNLNFLSQAEIEMINRISYLGFLFKQIQSFLHKYGGISTKLAIQLAYNDLYQNEKIKDQPNQNQNLDLSQKSEVDEEQDQDELFGVYIKAFCSGVNEIITTYKQHLLSIEHEYLKDRSLTIPSLQQKLAIYQQIFPAILSFMQNIEEQNLKGGQLLDAIYQSCTTGNPVIKSMFNKILFCCHRVLFLQINAWIVHGQLVDLCEEFFIHKINNSNQSMGKNQEGGEESKLNQTVNSITSISNINLVGSILTMDPESFGADDETKDDEWNSVYTLRISMLPCSYFPPSLAEKILFIGKAVRVLQSKKTQLSDRIPIQDLEAFSEAIMKLQKMPEFNVLLISRIIEEMRESIASRLLHLVVIKANLVEHLREIKNYFLISKGEFYQTFLEEARQIMSLPPQSSSEFDLNVGPLQQTIIKLGLEDDAYLRSGLYYIGDVHIDIKKNYSFRIRSQKTSRKSGALWHCLKQRLDMGFKTTFAFKFKNMLINGGGQGMNASIISGSVMGSPAKGSRNYMTNDQNSIMGPPGGRNTQFGNHNYNQTMGSFAGDESQNLGQLANNLGQDSKIQGALCFIIQNEKEVIPWKRTTPMGTSDLNSFISVKFLTKIQSVGGQLNQNRLSILRQQFQTQHLIQVWASTETSIGKIKTMIDDNNQNVSTKNEILLEEKDVTNEMDFMDNDSHQIQLEYSNDELRVFVIDGTSQQNQNKIQVMNLNLKISDYVKLDNGTAYLGFTHETLNLPNLLYIENWTFISEAKSNQQDPWNGLSLDYRSHWPLHLMFSPDVIEKYNTLFRFLLPIKRIQLDLQHVWAVKVRLMKQFSHIPAFRKTMLLRQHMSFLVDNLFSYLQVDVLESQWTKLEKGINITQDFEEVRLLHDKYLLSITEQCFLNNNQVLKVIQDVIHMCMLMCKLLKQLDVYNHEAVEDEFDKIKSNFENQSNKMFKLLSNFKNYHQSSPYLAQLLLRLDYNNYMSNLSEKIENERNMMLLGNMRQQQQMQSQHQQFQMQQQFHYR